MNSTSLWRLIILVGVASALPFAQARGQAANSGPAPFSVRAAQQLDLSFNPNSDPTASGPSPGSFRAAQQLESEVGTPVSLLEAKTGLYFDSAEERQRAFEQDREHDLDPDREHSTVRFLPFGGRR